MEIQFTSEQESKLNQIASQTGRHVNQLVLDVVRGYLSQKQWAMQEVDGPGRLLSECLALAEAHGSTVTLDRRFSEDLQAIISQREPLDTSAWD